MIEISDNTRGIWFVTLPTGDWMAHIETVEADRFKVTYRFRVIVDDKVWDSSDRKNWYSLEAPDLQKGIQAMRECAQKLKAAGGGESWELLRGGGTIDQFMEQFQELPFVNVKRVPKHQPVTA